MPNTADFFTHYPQAGERLAAVAQRELSRLPVAEQIELETAESVFALDRRAGEVYAVVSYRLGQTLLAANLVIPAAQIGLRVEPDGALGYDPPTCPLCRLPFDLLPGCTAPEAENYARPHDGHGVDAPCRNCGAHPDNLHHPGCCVAVCPRTDDQAAFCGCPVCDPVNARVAEACR